MTKSDLMSPMITIIRGLPGNGKTELARCMAKQTGALLVEPDMFLIRAGIYQYDPIQYQFATAGAIRCVQIAAQLCADVIYADVLPRVIEVLALVELYQTASQARTQYKIIDCKQLTIEQSIRRNTHNVRPEDIERMAAQWEPWTE